MRDADAYKACVEQVVRDAGGIDFLFSNTGIGVSGEVHEMSVEHFGRIVDVNIRGTVHGVLAAWLYRVLPGLVQGEVAKVLAEERRTRESARG